jgi:hypothetical protein
VPTDAPATKVFISYSHESADHMDRVLALSDRLRREGVDCTIDQYEVFPPEGWPKWALRSIAEAQFVLVVCTQVYRERFEGTAPEGDGLGAKWEGAVVTQLLYDSESRNRSFVPVIFRSEDTVCIPTILRGATHYDLGSTEGYDDLYRLLTGQPSVRMHELGPVHPMPPRQRHRDFFESLAGQCGRTPGHVRRQGEGTQGEGPTTDTLLSTLDEVYALRILGLTAQAEELAGHWLPSLRNIADRTILEALRDDVAIIQDTQKCVISESDRRARYQRLYNELSRADVKDAAGRGVLPAWVLKMESERLEYALAATGSEFSTDFREKAYRLVNRLREVYIESGQRSCSALARRVFQLLGLGELSIARQAIDEGLSGLPPIAWTRS